MAYLESCCHAISEKWRIFKYYLRFFIFGTGALILFTLGAPLMYRQPGHFKNKLVSCSISRMLATILSIKCIIKGQENILLNQGAVVVMNHQSLIDTLGLRELILLKVFTHAVVKKELWYILPVGFALWKTGTISINRLNKKKGIEVLDNIASALVDKKIRVLVCPEGKRHSGDELLPFKKGAFHMAIAAQVPIVPIVYQKYKFLDHDKCRFDSGQILMSILPPIPTTGLKKEDVSDLSDKTYAIMMNEYITLNAAD